MGIKEKKFGIVLFCFQVLFLILFAVLTDYAPDASSAHPANSLNPENDGSNPKDNRIKDLYPMFQDVHVMIFIGFGFLMTFLKRYGFSAVGLNMMIAAFVLQWALLFGGILHGAVEGHGITVDITVDSLLVADFAAAAVLITFGAVLGKTSPLQLIIISFLEIIVFLLNETIGLSYIKAVDVGGSMFVHVFGAYFGLALARVIYKSSVKENDNEGSVYHSDIFAMIGTVFLWLYWPSFNSALAVGDDQHRAVINTYLALSACCVTTFAVSSLLDKHSKLDMVHIQNATLAGGVAVGTTADMMIRPWGAVAIGVTAGCLSVVGYNFLTPLLASKVKVHDTCGVNNLHGMPGLLAAIAGACAAALATVDTYGYSLYHTFPARAPVVNSTELIDINAVFAVDAGDGRSAAAQAGMQLVALLVTLVFAIVGGTITGFIVKLPLFDQPRGREQPIMDDSLWWETPDDFIAADVNETELKPMNAKDFMNHDEDPKDV